MSCEQEPLNKKNERALAIFMWGLLRPTNLYISPSLSAEEFKEKFQLVHGRLCRQSSYLIGCFLQMLQPRTSVSETAVNVGLPSSFSFKEYSPRIFYRLRSAFRIKEYAYISSLTEKIPKLDENCNGRSKALFLHSDDRQLLIKIIVRREAMNLRKMLPDYYAFVTGVKMDTLLPQFLGLYRIRCSGFMSNTTFLLVQTHAAPTAKIVFDLKGTLLHRVSTTKERMAGVSVLKDVDFIESGTRIQIGQDAKQKLLQLLHRDVEFLVDHGVIDYSLLFSILVTSHAEPPTNRKQFTPVKRKNGSPDAPLISLLSEVSLSAVQTADNISMTSSPISDVEDPLFGTRFCVEHTNKEGLSIGLCFKLIDALSVYGTRKRAARFLKQIRHGRNVNTSSANPRLYGRRFLDFLGMNID